MIPWGMLLWCAGCVLGSAFLIWLSWLVVQTLGWDVDPAIRHLVVRERKAERLRRMNSGGRSPMG